MSQVCVENVFGRSHKFVYDGHWPLLINGIDVSSPYLLIRLSWNPQVYEPMEVLDLDHSDNHRRAPHWYQCVPWRICQPDDLQQPKSPVAAVQEGNHCL